MTSQGMHFVNGTFEAQSCCSFEKTATLDKCTYRISLEKLHCRKSRIYLTPGADLPLLRHFPRSLLSYPRHTSSSKELRNNTPSSLIVKAVVEKIPIRLGETDIRLCRYTVVIDKASPSLQVGNAYLVIHARDSHHHLHYGEP